MITLYAIKNKTNGRFITGTDFNYTPPRQIMSVCERPLLLTGYELLSEIQRRHINLSRYKVCTVEIKEVTNDELCV